MSERDSYQDILSARSVRLRDPDARYHGGREAGRALVLDLATHELLHQHTHTHTHTRSLTVSFFENRFPALPNSTMNQNWFGQLDKR